MTTNEASYYRQGDGRHSWHYAPSGTADTAITFSEAMRIDNNGNVGIGTSSPATAYGKVLHIHNPATTGSNLRLTNSTSGSGTGNGFEIIQLGVDDYLINREAGAMVFYTSSTERMRIDSSGNVGIGTDSPSEKLHISTSGNSKIILQTTSSASRTQLYGVDNLGNNNYALGTLNNTDTEFWNYKNGYMRFATNSTERMRINSSGTFMVGKTSSDVDTSGFEVASNGNGSFCRSNNLALYLVRNSSDGEIVQFRKDGASVGNIGSYLGSGVSQFYISGADTGFKINSTVDVIGPSNASGSNRDNAITLGDSGNRFKDLYLGGNIYLGGTGSANALDDYEEGTWTPTLTFSSSASGSLNYTQQEGIYVKVGRLVHVSVFVAWNANNFSANSGSFEIQGLPFVNNNNNLYRGGASITYSSGAFASLTIYGQAFRAESSQSKFRFNYGPNTGGNISSEVNNYTNIGSAGSFMISGTYQTN